jgi:hypothetical protein
MFYQSKMVVNIQVLDELWAGLTKFMTKVQLFILIWVYIVVGFLIRKVINMEYGSSWMSRMKFSKFVSLSLFCLKNSKLKFSLEWDCLKKDTIKQVFCWEPKKDTIKWIMPIK